MWGTNSALTLTPSLPRLPAYFVVPAPLPEESVSRFQGHGVPVSASGNPDSRWLLIGPSWQIVRLKPLALVPKSLSSVQE